MKEITIMAAGELISGKTSFLNALLGEEIFPNGEKGWSPATRTTIELHYGDCKRAYACFRNPMPKDYTAALTSDMQNQIENYKYSDMIPPISFDWDDLPEHILSEAGEKNVPIDNFYLSAPNSFLKDGICLIDTKGYVVENTNNYSLKKYLSKPDILLFFISADQMILKEDIIDFSNSQKDFLSLNIAPGSWKYLCFVITNLDQIQKNADQLRISQALPALLNRYIPNLPYRIYYTRPDYAYAAEVKGMKELLPLSGLANIKIDLYTMIDQIRHK